MPPSPLYQYRAHSSKREAGSFPRPLPARIPTYLLRVPRRRQEFVSAEIASARSIDRSIGELRGAESGLETIAPLLFIKSISRVSPVKRLL